MAKKRSNSRKVVASQLSADRPITQKRQDLLGRGRFASQLADDISGWKGEDSLVVGIYGPWGVGKTSLKNLVLEAIQSRKASPAVLEFNPWQLSGTGGIAASFFEELKILVEREGEQEIRDGGRDSRIAKRLGLYSKKLRLAGLLTAGLSSMLAAVGREELGLLAGTLGTGLGAAGEIAGAAGEVSDAKAAGSELSIHELKFSISENLRSWKKPIIVVIDDVDRLSTAEILSVLQLVKVNADFPNIVYLLLCERSVVCKALDEISGGRGTEFIEKIIQVSYHIPESNVGSVKRVLMEGLERTLGGVGASKTWNRERWTEIYLDGVAPFFRNLRHVYRFLPSLSFHARQFQQGDHFEVNAIDLVGLEVLRVFEPGVFERLKSSKQLLTRERGFSIFKKVKQEDVEAGVDGLIADASRLNAIHVRALLSHLFPTVLSRYSDGGYLHQDARQWVRDVRICSAEIFDRYFSLNVEEHELAQSDFEEILLSLSDPGLLEDNMRRLNKRGVVGALLERLDYCSAELKDEELDSLVTVLLNLTDEVHIDDTGFFNMDLFTQSARFVFDRLKRMTDSKRRFEYAREAFERAGGLSLPVYVTSIQSRTPERDRQYFFEEDDWALLKELCVNKLRSAASHEVLKSHRDMSFLVWRWHYWDGVKAKEWVDRQYHAPAGVVWLLSFLSYQVTTHGLKHTVHQEIRLDNVETFADLRDVEAKLDLVNETTLSEHEREVIAAFRKALSVREK